MKNSDHGLKGKELVDYVIHKCDVMTKARLWPSVQKLRSRAWINNFDQEDKYFAALLLDNFIFCNEQTVDSFLVSSWQSVGDAIPKGPHSPKSQELIDALDNVIFTPVEGEKPNRTDSGNLMCRKARQILDIPSELILEPEKAIEHVKQGKNIVFLDDFVGSGDQFLETWKRKYTNGVSFASAYQSNDYTVIYLNLVCTRSGVNNIYAKLPHAAICPAHILENDLTIQGMMSRGVLDEKSTINFLKKYASRLNPKEPYMHNGADYLLYGYKKRGLLVGFEHSIPDATLPIFWSPGSNNWEPLIERK